MAWNVLKVRGAILFKKEGLNEDWVKEELSKDVSVIDVIDDSVTYTDDNDVERSEIVRSFLVETSMGGFLTLKLKWNCFSLPDNPFILFPR